MNLIIVDNRVILFLCDRTSPIRCVGERITATGVPEFREVAWRA
ncbi:hypothetical protein [Bathymodiolus platifrons methanotrophic gill symbiont]|nr:hypothetical protein [Bathymodiolus platifrons methanotrophic gill symbiont]